MADEDRENQRPQRGDRGGRNEGRPERPKPAPKVVCQFCQTEVPRDATHCVKAGCGQPLRAKCPNCENFAVNRPDGACDKCGTALRTPTKKAEPEELFLSVTHTGEDGEYQLTIQISGKDGDGKKAVVWICYGKRETIKPTDDNGFLTFQIPSFTCQQKQVTVGIKGRKANTVKFSLAGPPYDPPADLSFIERIIYRIKHLRDNHGH